MESKCVTFAFIFSPGLALFACF